MNRILVEYDGAPDKPSEMFERDSLIDSLAERLGLMPGDTGYSLIDGVRDHSICVGQDRALAYSVAAEFRRALPWARVRVWPEDDA